MKIVYTTIILLFFLHTSRVHAQFLDSLQLTVGSMATVAARNYQPFWLVSNRYGTINDQQFDVTTHLRVSNKHILGSNRQLFNYLRSYERFPEVGIEYGLDVYVNQLFSAAFFREGYLKLNVNNWQLSAGRFEQLIGEVNPELSSGSLGVSNNALPIPRVSLAVKEYTDIPLTNGWLQFKGLLSHGWLEQGYVTNTLLHEKNIYLRGGNRNFGVYGGFNHFAVWGGNHPTYGTFSTSFGDYWKNVFGQIADMENPNYTEQRNQLGDHRGFVDYGLDANFRDFKISFYNQVPFENGDNIQPVLNANRLMGISVVNKTNKTIFSALTLEYINTSHRTIDNQIVSFDNFYNNPIYQTGWSYLGNIIGTPLFTDLQRAELYFGSSPNPISWNIVNNRVKGVHMGLKGRLPANLHFRTLLTYMVNYGNSYNSSEYYPGRRQWYIMQEMVYQYNSWKLNATLGADVGEMTNNAGLLIGIAYELNRTARSPLDTRRFNGRHTL